MRVYTIGFRNRFVAILALLVVLGVGAGLLLIGLALLAGLAVAGTVIGVGVLAYRALRAPRAGSVVHRAPERLDPDLEVFAGETTSGPADDTAGSEPVRRLGPG